MGEFKVTRISGAGSPTITFHVRGDTITAELAGALLYVEGGRADGGADMRLTANEGEVLASIVINPRPHRDMTENVTDIGSALLWSHWRYVEAQAKEAAWTAAAAAEQKSADVCDHTYSKAMNQPYPRACTKCGAMEKPQPRER